MYQSKQDKKPQVDTNTTVFDSKAFFEAIAKNTDSAYAQLREQVPSHGIATPRAQELIEAGEWDAVDRFAIKCLKEGRCLGYVGSTPAGAASPLRFCGRKLAECTVQSHRVNAWGEFQPGWFVPGGNTAKSGYYKSPRLPNFVEGGPISQEVANAIAAPSNPFELTLGQWRLAIDSWWEDRVKAASDSESFGSPSTGVSSRASSIYSPSPDISSFNKSTFGQVKTDPQAATFFPKPTPPQASAEEEKQPHNVDNLTKQVEVLTRTVATLMAKLALLQTGQTQVAKQSAETKSEVETFAHMFSNQNKQRGFSEVDPDRIIELENMVTGLTGICKEVQDSTVHLNALVSDPDGPVEQTREQLVQLSKQVRMGGGVEAHGIRFRDPSEIRPWLSAVADPLALFHDAVTLLHCIGATSVTHKDSLSMIKAQKDARINNDLEARVITSFRTRLPAIFYGGGASGSVDEFVPLGSKLKSYADWHSEDNVSGVSQRMMQGIQEIHDRVRQVSFSQTTHPEILRLSNGLIVDSVNFIHNLVSFVDMQYLDLTAGTYFTQAQVWDILVATIERVFEDMRRARAPIQDVAGDTDRSALLWGILKCHEVMKRYISNDFRNDPSIHGILVQKILRCSPTSTVTSKVVALEKSLTITSSKVNSLQTRVNVLEAKK